MTSPFDPAVATEDTGKESEPLDGKRFNPNQYNWYGHLKTAIEEMRIKVPNIDVEWSYYDGNHPRIWLTDTLHDMFDDQLADNMSENWCELAVEAPVRRLNVTGWLSEMEGAESSPDDGSKKQNTVQIQAAENIFKDNDLELEQKEIYRQARAVGESFVILWKDEEKESGIDVAINDARNIWWPATGKRNDPDRVIKIWMSEDEGIWRATVYYRYVVVRLVGPKINAQKSIPDARHFVIDTDDPGGEHGFEKVPVIRFASQRRRKGIIGTVRKFQDKINKLAANKLVAAEFNAWGKTIILTTQEIDDDVLKFRPNKATILDPGGDATSGVAPTSIWESTPLELLNYDQSISTEIDKLFTAAQLPGHMQVKSTREVPSGASYDADEGPFTEMIEDMQETFGASFTDMMAMCGVDVKPQWRNAHIRSDTDEATTVKAFVESKVPVSLALKYYAGWTEDMLNELMNAPLSAQETQQLALAEALKQPGADNEDAESGDTEPIGGGSGRVPSGSNVKPTPKP